MNPAIPSLDFETLTPHIPDLHKKQVVTAQSLRKVEEGWSLSLLYPRQFSLISTSQLPMLSLYAALNTSSHHGC